MSETKNTVPAIERAVDVLECISSSDREMSLSDIIEQVDIPRQSLIRILNTLCSKGFLDKSGKRGLYRIGLKFLYLGHRLHDKYDLRNSAWKHMKALSIQTRKTIELATLDRDQLILLEQIRGSESMSLYSRVGSAIPYLHAVSVGKVYLSLMSKEKRRQVIKKIGMPAITKYTITDPEILETELIQAKKCGFGFEDQELREGVRRIAAPIFNSSGKHVGCIGISAPIFNFDLKDKEKYGELVVDAARKTSADMGYPYDPK
ncbi:IclR family transcriptional regulator [Desulfosarcina ovata]|uniref:IclR family transcriptional regulator n=2 Tax=Desulfosarcina ovata TaxID=83564 RepID=A0A5K8AHQ4_9BACT|nr:IclR family transcriptional regulator [Desulfosarcina ovata]BBO85318.1 IclR family transcriptional regulator [Desulfosarcina ovata subsp. sediminis]BBO92215.1 IclR family transcriptional regulator [Desulfosarcina ovata subsp. ovata]